LVEAADRGGETEKKKMEGSFVISSLLLHLPLLLAATIKGPPIASQRNLQLLARLGDEVKLVCPMEGNPAPIIEWSKGEQMVDYQMTRYKTSKKSLKIRDVDKTDSGRFTCKGINGFGKEEIKIDLIIIDPVDFPGLPEGALPEVTPPALTSDTLAARSRFSKKPEETLRISCGALGKPKPVVTWYKNGHELLENVREKHGKSVLHLRRLNVRDSGRFTCVARNMVGEASKNFTVEVEDEGTDPPNFSHAPMNRTVREGEPATFDCRVSLSYSRPHIKWLKKVEASDTGFNLSEVIPVGSDKYRLIHTSREIPLTSEGEILSQLLLRGVSRGDAGMYVCFVTSTRGGFNYRPAYLTVIPRTESLVNESPPVLILVICLSVVVLGILIAIIACVVRRRTKEPISPPDSAEVEMLGIAHHTGNDAETQKANHTEQNIASGATQSDAIPANGRHLPALLKSLRACKLLEELRVGRLLLENLGTSAATSALAVVPPLLSIMHLIIPL